MNIPERIRKIVGNINCKLDDVGRSEDRVYLFEDKYILKVSSNKERIEREKERFDWLYQFLPTIQSLDFFEENNEYYYLRTQLNGDSLIEERITSDPKLLISILKEVDKFLNSIKDCPFKSNDSIGESFIHGDLCLPNIYVDKDNNFIGFIDLENMGLGDKWYDYAWLIWSFERNIGSRDYTDLLLNELGIRFNKEKYDEYIPSDCIDELNMIIENNKYNKLAKEKWGNSKEYKEFESKNYSNNELDEKNKGLMLIFKDFGDIKDKGINEESLKLVKKLQDYISDNYYKCNNQILASLGEMYKTEEFTKNIDNVGGNGTSKFVSECIKEYVK